MMLAEVYEEMGNLPQALTLVTFGKSIDWTMFPFQMGSGTFGLARTRG